MSRLIVSFTSYPGRIHYVKDVLNCLYAQTLPADEIILWLAEDEFPKKEADLPISLQNDLQKQRFSIRWCDNLGSHKKYFYVMQEYPEDIIVTVDDDTYYHPDCLEKLMDAHERFPNAVAAMTTALVQLDKQLHPLPMAQWEYDFQQIQEPSMLLVAVNVGGTLYPPNSINRKIFDKELIKDFCTINGRVLGDDLLLKAGEMLNNTLVVSVKGETYYRLSGTQKSALSNKSRNRKHKNLLIKKLEKRFGSEFNQNDQLRLKSALAAFEEADKYDDLLKKYRIGRPMRELDRVIGYLTLGDAFSEIGPSDYAGVKNAVQFATRVFRAYPPATSGEETMLALKQFLSKVKSISGIEELAKQDIVIRGVCEYNVLLSSDHLLIYRGIPIYMKSLLNWHTFLKNHPECSDAYYETFCITMNRIDKAVKKEQLQKADKDAWNKAYSEVSQEYAVHFRKYNSIWGHIKRLRKIYKKIARWLCD